MHVNPATCAIAVGLLLTGGCGKEAQNPTVEKPAEIKTPDEHNSSMISQVSKLYENAKESGKTTAANATEWIAEVYDETLDSGAETVNQTGDWVNQLYESARQSGETTATNVKDWTVSDLKKAGAWEYTVLTVETSGDWSPIETEMNRLGSDRWECFWVDKQEGKTIFVFKKQKKSYLKQLPAKELMRFMPLLQSGDVAEQH